MVGSDVIGIRLLFPAREQLNGIAMLILRYRRTTLRGAGWSCIVEEQYPLTGHWMK